MCLSSPTPVLISTEITIIISFVITIVISFVITVENGPLELSYREDLPLDSKLDKGKHRKMEQPRDVKIFTSRHLPGVE